MSTKRPRHDSTESQKGDQSKRGESVARPAIAPPERKDETMTMHLIELRPGLFLNPDHVVSLRVLPQEEQDRDAILQLSSGEKQNLTRDEFTAITGKESRPRFDRRRTLMWDSQASGCPRTNPACRCPRRWGRRGELMNRRPARRCAACAARNPVAAEPARRCGETYSPCCLNHACNRRHPSSAASFL